MAAMLDRRVSFAVQSQGVGREQASVRVIVSKVGIDALSKREGASIAVEGDIGLRRINHRHVH